MRCWNSSREAHEVCSLCKYYSGCCFRQQNLSLLVCRSKIPFKVVETWYASKRVERQLILGFSIWDAYNTQRKACLLLVLRLIFGKCSWMKMTLYKSFCGWYLQQLMAEHLREWVLDYTIHSGCQSQNASFGQKTQSSFENLFSLVIDGATLVPDAYKWMSSCNTPSLSTKGVTVYIRFCQIIWVTDTVLVLLSLYTAKVLHLDLEIPVWLIIFTAAAAAGCGCSCCVLSLYITSSRQRL
jgi:hypothetical protein